MECRVDTSFKVRGNSTWSAGTSRHKLRSCRRLGSAAAKVPGSFHARRPGARARGRRRPAAMVPSGLLQTAVGTTTACCQAPVGDAPPSPLASTVGDIGWGTSGGDTTCAASAAGAVTAGKWQGNGGCTVVLGVATMGAPGGSGGAKAPGASASGGSAEANTCTEGGRPSQKKRHFSVNMGSNLCRTNPGPSQSMDESSACRKFCRSIESACRFTAKPFAFAT
mmetsp:Transcript_78067/g.181078  ORF Transcript_78067/g.181078 Transcript_78067/m.181078 type:complete len:223 (-) Transcript_78067:2104-2772(-)